MFGTACYLFLGEPFGFSQQTLMSLENLHATKRLCWWRTHRPLTVKFWLTPGEELTPNLQPGPPGSTRSRRPARWPLWPCFPNVATRPSYAYLRPDAGTRWGTSCPPWTSTTTTCQSSPRALPSPPCLVRAGLTQTWACGDSAVWINTMVCPPHFPFWVEAQRYEPTKIDLQTTFWDERSQCWVICGLKSLPEAFRTLSFGSRIGLGWFSFVQGFICRSITLAFLSHPLCSPWHLRLMQSSSYYVNAVAMAPRSCLQPTNASPLTSSLPPFSSAAHWYNTNDISNPVFVKQGKTQKCDIAKWQRLLRTVATQCCSAVQNVVSQTGKQCLASLSGFCASFFLGKESELWWWKSFKVITNSSKGSCLRSCNFWNMSVVSSEESCLSQLLIHYHAGTLRNCL